MKFMKISTICIITMAVLTILGSQAAAHPPGFVVPKYEENSLKVTIMHFTLSPFRSHYIYRIDIEKNGQEYILENYEEQPRFLFFSYTYDVETEVGDEIKITAFCSLFGQKSRTIIV